MCLLLVRFMCLSLVCVMCLVVVYAMSVGARRQALALSELWTYVMVPSKTKTCRTERDCGFAMLIFVHLFGKLAVVSYIGCEGNIERTKSWSLGSSACAGPVSQQTFARTNILTLCRIGPF